MQKRTPYCCVLKTESAGPVETSAPTNQSARNHSPQGRDIDTGEPQNPIKQQIRSWRYVIHTQGQEESSLQAGFTVVETVHRLLR